MDYRVPSRGLIGFRTEFLTETRGTGIANQLFEGYRPWAGELRTRHSGSLVADRTGPVTGHAVVRWPTAATFFVEPTRRLHGHGHRGEPAAEDMEVNIAREKKLTNMRQSSQRRPGAAHPAAHLSLEQALEFCANDECVEVTPTVVRVRKLVLDATTRGRERSRAKTRDQNAK